MWLKSFCIPHLGCVRLKNINVTHRTKLIQLHFLLDAINDDAVNSHSYISNVLFSIMKYWKLIMQRHKHNLIYNVLDHYYEALLNVVNFYLYTDIFLIIKH